MKILILSGGEFSIGPRRLLSIQEAAPGVTLDYVPADNIDLDRFASAEIIFGMPQPELLHHAASLEWLHLPTTAVDRYVSLSLYARRTVSLTKSVGVFGIPVAEHALAMLLSLSRSLPRFLSDVSSFSEAAGDEPDGFEIFGSTVTVLGMGSIGIETARRLSAFGCKVIGVRRNILEKPPAVDRICDLRSLYDALKQSRIVVNCLPLTSETRSLIGYDELSAMKRGSVFISVGSDKTVNLEALAESLEARYIAGAGIDLISSRSADADISPARREELNRLAALDNVIITPGTGGFSQNMEERLTRLFISQLGRYRGGRHLQNTVDFFSGY